MATYGSRDKNAFKIPETYNINGNPVQSNSGNARYYLLVDSVTGDITVKTADGKLPSSVGGSTDTDRTVGTIPKDGVFKPVDGLTTTSETQYFTSAQGQKDVKNHAVITAQKAGAQNAQQLIFPNTATPGAGQGQNQSPGDPIPIGTPTTLDLGIPESNFLKNFGNPVRYPTDIGNNGQDYIKFDLVEYGSREFASNPESILNKPLGTRSGLTESAIATVILPIQPQISDQNGVSWGEEQMNAFQIAMAAAARSPNNIPDLLTIATNSFADNKELQDLLLKYVAGQAVGINPLARTDGLILNPNLELLFNNPTLRPFTFTFRLSPRDKPEATDVKKIIRFFKEGSVVRTTNTGLFLKAPRVFNIKYIQNSEKKEEGLNLIKTCALRNVSVNYTPDGSYMTFRDGTMTSYELSLQFSELEPIYDVDYNDNEVKDHPIGY